MSVPVMSTLVLGLAWFAAVNVLASALAWMLAAALLPTRAARRGAAMLALRLFPAAVSSLFVSLLFVPAHWRFEPADSQERLGLILWLLSLAGAALLVRSAARVVSVARAGWRLRAVDACPVDLAPGVYEVPGLAGISLAGVIRTRILVGSAVRRALDRAELDVALAHERAHRRSLDNVKRFVMFCAPDVFGAWAVAREVESRWHATAESLADARAVRGDGVRAVHLASALVKVSRLASASALPVSSPAWSTLHDPPLLEQRVRCLVDGTTPSVRAARPAVSLAATALLGAAFVAVSVFAYPAVHQLTEALVRVLP
jgi:hypothetical protein